MTLRAQIALGTGLIALIVVALAGTLIALRMDRRDRATVDSQLRDRAERVVSDTDKLLTEGHPRDQHANDGYGDLLDDSESLVRLFRGTSIIAQRGAIPDEQLAPPTDDGFTTVDVDGAPWRSYVVFSNDDIRLQVLQTLEPVNDRRSANTRLVALVTFLAAALSGVAGWLVGGRILRPLDRLAKGAAAIACDPDPGHRLPSVTHPPEVGTLSITLNGMLDRLGASTETTRRFAADVGHELRGPLTVSSAYVETLLTSEDLPDTARESLAAINDQQQRMVSTLNALQVLARVDAGALPPRSDFEPGLLVEELVRLARNRHPSVAFSFVDTTGGTTVSGWNSGIRIAIDNLLDNAAIHGRPDGNVDTTVTVDDSTLRITISDDGPGIPSNDHERLIQRFSRGHDATGPGTGLGLALADQQAALHSGGLTLGASPRGGLTAELSLPIAPA